jgi:hypothetical protein
MRKIKEFFTPVWILRCKRVEEGVLATCTSYKFMGMWWFTRPLRFKNQHNPSIIPMSDSV